SPEGRTMLPDLFDHQVAVTPDATAACCGDARLTYAELDELADDLAAELAGRGIGAEDLVGVCLARGFWSVIALLAIWKAGAAYVPLARGYPPERLRFMTADAGLSLIITDQQTTSTAASLGIGQITVGHQPPPGTPRQASPADPSHLAYVIYT